MNKFKSILRISVLIALTAVGIIGIFSVPQDNSLTWTRDLLLSKAIGFAAFYAISRIYPRWVKSDPWLRSYDKHCDKALEAKDPSQLP